MPWWSSWKTACWASVPTPPQMTGAVGRPTGVPSSGHRLAVRFHLELLEVERAAAAAARHRRRRRASGARTCGVETVDEGGEQRRVLRRLGVAEMAVHRRRALEQFLERVPAERQRGRQADRRPQRIAPADAFAERQDAGLVDAALDRRFRARR